MKEMVGGCCVCSDERGWDENPLVYCDGPACNVAVHQACYGIVAVPSGPWYCRKCESTERSGRVRCELCPSRDGAFKKTDNGSWAHVVCALYIPEVRFENVSTMEPILISLIPQERYNKTCYICEERRDKKDSRAAMGACMQCNKAGCKQHFHVTCAQMLGLLCEEAGNMMDNVKYCGYCEHHYSKLVSPTVEQEVHLHKFTALDIPNWSVSTRQNDDNGLWLNFQKKSSNLKIIPPFKPIPSGNTTESPTSSPEKNGKGATVVGNNSGTPEADSSPQGQGHGGSNMPLNTIGDNILKSVGNSKSSSRRSSGHGKASSVSSASSNGSTTNNNANISSPSAMPRIQIQTSNLFSSSGVFSSYSSSVINTTPGSANSNPSRKSRSKSRSPSTEEIGPFITNVEKIPNPATIIASARSSFSGNGGKSNDEDPKLNSKGESDSRGNKQGQEQVTTGTATIIPSSFSKLKELATVSMKEVISSAVDKSLNSGSKFERSGSASLGSGLSEPVSYNSSSTGTGNSRIDKPPPEIVPHVTLTPIPMKSSDEPSKNDRSPSLKSPVLFQTAAFGQGGKQHEPMDTEMATISLEKSSSHHGKRMRLSLHTAPPQDFDSETESATEEWPEDMPRSQCNSLAMTSQKEQIRRASNETASPRRTLTPSHVSEILHWEAQKSPTVSLERIQHPTSTACGVKEGQGHKFPFGSNSTYPPEFSTRKRGAGRMSKGMTGSTGRDDEIRGKGLKRGRRGSVTSYGRRESGITNGNVGSQVMDEAPGDSAKLEDEGAQGINNGSVRGGRHNAPPSRKGSAMSTVSSAQNSPNVSRKPSYDDSRKSSYADSRKSSLSYDESRKSSYDDSPTLTMSQLKAQMASASSSPEKSASLAPHMFGNALNPASSMAQRMVDTLSQEMETIGAGGEMQPDSVIASTTPLVGITFPGKSTSLLQSSVTPKVNGVGTNGLIGTVAKPQPQTLEELLERQWEQGSQFLMEQAQHLDISQLLSCLNQLKADNKALEDHVASLCQRKEQLTAINARLSIPLGSTNTLGLGLGFSGNTNRQETPPNSAIIPSKTPAVGAHSQLQLQHIQQQQEVIHQAGANPYQQPQHRGSVGNVATSQQQQHLYGYAGQGPPSSGQAHLPPHQTPRDNR